MNKKGNMFSALMIVFMLFIIGMTITNFLMPEVSQARIDADCTNAAGITDGTKLMCLFIDSTIIYWIVLVFSIIGGIIVDKLIQ